MFSWIKSLQEFCSYASIPGLHYIGQRNAHIIQRLFWIVAFISAVALFVAGCYAAISDFKTKTTQIVSEDRQASLDQIFFPSLVICNVNKFRRSFVYYIIDNLQNEGILNKANGSHHQETDEEQEVFDMIRGYFFEGFERNLTKKEEGIKTYILESNFYKSYVQKFLKVAMSRKMNISLTSEVFLYSEAQFNYLEIKESQESENMFQENVFAEVAKQWEEGQIIVDLKWHGGKNQNKEKSNVYLEQGFGTSDGICSWITPMFDKFIGDFSNLEKGSFFGINKGLSLLLDAESYDYVRYEGEGLRFNMPIIQGNGVGIKPGYLTQLGVSTILTEVTNSARSRFEPYDRKCWHSSEIEF